MATPRWIGAALDVYQQDKITIANTWAAADTATVTIGTRDLTLTVGTDTSTTAVAQAIVEMLNGEDQTGTGDHTFSDTGDNVPEFTEIEASRSGSIVFVTARTAGVPFTMTSSEVTAGTGTATRASVTACTGKNFWDNADNWDTGSTPADTDTVYIDNTDVSILYGLDQSAIEPAALYIAQSFTGTIGLPEANPNGYHEYRSTYLSLGPAILKIGDGPGNGSGRIRINSTSDQCALTVLNSGAPLDDVPAIVWKGTNASNTLVMTAGSLGVAVYGAETATLSTWELDGGDLRLGTGVTLSGALVANGGTALVNSLIDGSLTTASGAVVTINGVAGVDQLTVDGGTVVYNTSGTLGGSTTVAGDGVLDFSGNGIVTQVTNAIDMFGTLCRILDPNGRVWDGSTARKMIVDGNRGADPGTQVVWGRNYRLTRGATA